MYCGNCGNELKDGAKFCGRCGERAFVPAFCGEEAETKKKNKLGKRSWKFRIIAAVMAIVIAVSVFAVKAAWEEGYKNQWAYTFYYFDDMSLIALYYNSEGDVQTYVSFDMEDDCNFVPVAIRNYQYDGKGRTEEISVYSLDDGSMTLSSYWVYEYNNSEHEYTMYHYWKGELKSCTVAECDKKWNVTLSREYDGDGELIEKTKYDDNGNITGNYYYTDGVRSSYIVYEYDSDGNMLSSEERYDDSVTQYFYEYDENGKVTDSKLYRNGGLSYHYEYVYEYDGNHVISGKKYTGNDALGGYSEMELIYTTKYEYDKKGNLIADYYETESENEKRSREYDSDGNMTYLYYYDSSSDLACDGVTMEFTYGKSGEMLTATFIGENESDTVKTAFTYEGGQIQYIATYSYDGSLEGYYAFEYNDDGELTGFGFCDGSDADVFTQGMFSALYEGRFA